jgi:protease-4
MTEVLEGDTAQAKKSHSVGRTIAIFFVVIVIALVGAYFLSSALIPEPKIGVIDIQAPIGGALAEVISLEVDYALNARDIEGVVLLINSPGGPAYVDGLAASAGYLVGVAANEVYAKPASFVGNVGVIMGQPGPETLSERFITTGPFKATGASATSLLQKLDLLHADFRDTVVAERSQAPNPLKISADELATGELWIGIEAKEYGLIDELGSNLDAINRAAELAGLADYEVVNVRDEYLASLEGPRLDLALERYDELEALPEIDLSAEQVEWPSFYQLYIPLE